MGILRPVCRATQGFPDLTLSESVLEPLGCADSASCHSLRDGGCYVWRCILHNLPFFVGPSAWGGVESKASAGTVTSVTLFLSPAAFRQNPLCLLLALSHHFPHSALSRSSLGCLSSTTTLEYPAQMPAPQSLVPTALPSAWWPSSVPATV